MATKSAEQILQDHDSDIVWSAREIGKVIGRTERQTYHLLVTKRLPARNHGGIYSASRQRLLAHAAGEEVA